jgi:ABC-2 type transport system permease protein
MMRILVRKELLAVMRDGRAWILGLAILGLVVSVFGIAHLELERARIAERTAEAAARSQWDVQGEKHPHRGAHFGMYVFAPDSPLAAFDPGISRFLGNALWMEPHKRNMLRFSEAADAPVAGRFSQFTPAFVLTAILPLLVVGLGFGAVVQERESGTLRMLRGLAVRKQEFVWSKFVALSTASASALALAFILIMIPLSWQTESADVLARGALLGLVFLGYAGTFVALAIAVSAFSTTARQALLVLLTLWILLVFIVPRSAAAIAEQAVRLPTPVEFWSAIKRDYERGLPGDGDLATRGKRFDEDLLRRYDVKRLEDLPVGAYAIRRLERDAYADKVHQLHFNELWRRFARQEAILRNASFFSPALAMQLTSMKLAGTDLQHRRHFEEAAEAYRRRINTRIDEWDAAHSRGLRSFDDKYGNDALWQSMDRFTYKPLSAGSALRLAMPDASILALWCLMAMSFLAAAAWRLRL